MRKAQIGFTLEGLEEFEATLKAMEDAVKAKALLPGFRRAVKPFINQAKANIDKNFSGKSRRGKNGEVIKPGRTKASFRVMTRTGRNGAFQVIAGPRSPQGNVLRIVEYGTQERFVRTRTINGKKVTLKTPKSTGRIRPMKIIASAIVATRTQIQANLANEVRASIQRYVKRTSRGRT